MKFDTFRIIPIFLYLTSAIDGFAEPLQTFTIPFSLNRNDVLNPDRGVYRFRPLTKSSDFSSVRLSGASLVYSELDLTRFRSRQLSKDRLSDIDQAFSAINRSGIKAIVRIVYSHAVGEPDAEMNWIKTHLEQLAPIFERHASVIFAFQAGCIGPWGEWHSSLIHRDNPDARTEVLRALLSNVPRQISVHVRRPIFKQEFASTPDSEPGLTRIGHHNDCLLADATDMGTYSLADVAANREFLYRESATVPFGGETCRKSPEFTRCDLFLTSLSRLGATYLNGDYSPEVIAELVHQGCWKEIRLRLGYRIEIQKIELTREASQNFTGKIVLANTGWAPFYTGRTIVVRLRGKEGSVEVINTLIVDQEQTGPGRSIEVPIKFKGVDLEDSSLTLAIPDRSTDLSRNASYSIRIPNAKRWDELNGENILLEDLAAEVSDGSGSAPGPAQKHNRFDPSRFRESNQEYLVQR